MQPILLSTDIGSDIDDALSLLVMLNHPEIHISGIYTVNGKVAERCYIAKHMVDLAQRDIPVCCGIAKPLGAVVNPFSYFEEYLVDDSFIDEEATEEDRANIHYKGLSECGIHEDGIAHMADQLRAQEHAILSLGPLTNVATLISRYPDVVKRISGLYLMGFRITGDLEHNVRFDSVAANKVLESGIPITVIPGDTCRQYQMEWTEKTLFESDVGRYVTSMLRGYMGAKIVEQSREIGLITRMMESIPSADARTRVGLEKFDSATDFKHVLLVNFDEATAFLDRDKFLGNLLRLSALFKDPNFQFGQGNLLGRCIQELLTRKVLVSDAFVPYCLLHPERCTTLRMGLGCRMDGGSITSEKGPHEVLLRIDPSHFHQFLCDYLH